VWCVQTDGRKNSGRLTNKHIISPAVPLMKSLGNSLGRV